MGNRTKKLYHPVTGFPFRARPMVEWKLDIENKRRYDKKYKKSKKQ